MDYVEFYYIEIKMKSYDNSYHKVIINRSDIPLPQPPTEQQYTNYVYDIYMAYCKSREHYHYALRTKSGIYHGLISEYFSDMSVPMWYTTYNEFKRFADNLPFNPIERGKIA